MLAAKQFVCGSDKLRALGVDVPRRMINTWCWIHSTLHGAGSIHKRSASRCLILVWTTPRGAASADQKGLPLHTSGLRLACSSR
ncbi:hypothetical protein LSTR_LSTR016883 [Laodelphax striatellus]|uniref:Uncharacterized protein n=1 Tax=Laodelphax striatellus TaxID=195883 RepID=A0A482WT55_LAOST|nr:hypothetical protein LSTR_LSTR016883 [Laodelphax striatellus]